jgi:16S rRNA (guanine527-N7)-methyltransferase
VTGDPPISDVLHGALAEARALGFLGPGPLEAHVRSAASFLDALTAVAAAGPALDLGSGGGVPGLILAEWLPEWDWTLLDANRRRTSFLARVASRAVVGNVEAVRARAEDAARGPARGTYSVVTARSFGPPATTAEAAAPFLRVDGHLVVAEPPEHVDRWDAEGLERLGLAPTETSTGVATFRLVSPVPAEFPRTIKQQQRSPLW